MTNWCVGIAAIVVLVLILRSPDKGPKLPQADKDPRSILDHLEPVRAGGAMQEAGPTINPTGLASTMITYDKI